MSTINHDVAARPACTANAQVGFGAACMRLWQRSDFRALAWVALVAMVVSKVGVLRSGLSVDDYAYAFPVDVPKVVVNFISQGRGINLLPALFLKSLGASFTGVAWFAFLLSLVTIPLAIATAIALVKRTEANHLHHYMAAALVATHPYLTSYFLFKMSILNTAMVYALLAGLLVLFTVGRSPWQRVLCCVLLVLACHLSQIVLVLFVVATLAWALARFCEARNMGRDYWVACGGVVAAVVVNAGAAVLYLASNLLVRHLTHIYAVAQYNPHVAGGISGVLGRTARLSYELLLSGGLAVPRWVQVWLVIVIAVLVVGCALRQPLRAIASVLALIGGLFATVSPMAFSWGGFVPRTFSPAGLCFGLTICMAGDGVTWPRVRAFALATAVPIIAYCVIGSALFYQQWLLTKWDERTAEAVYQRAVPEAGGSVSIRIAASWPVYGQPLSLVDPSVGLNGSAFYFPWSYPGLFAVATGATPDVAAAEPSACKGMPSWPAAGATRRLASGAMLVCIGNTPR